MLRNSSEIMGYTIGATDGQLGKVSDLLFDDATWLVRWLVVDTGWLTGRTVLIPPSVLKHFSPVERQFSVRLSTQQIKDSPGTSMDLPVSRQMETDIYSYYGWSPYWNSDVFMGGYGYMGIAAEEAALDAQDRDARTQYGQRRRGNPYLRSVQTVTGYHIKATDGEIGHVDDFIVEDEDWSVHYLVVDTKNWWPGKKVLISPRSAREIDWAGKTVDLAVSREVVKDSPGYDPKATLDRSYQKSFDDYYEHDRA